jgi:hypothetical protein
MTQTNPLVLADGTKINPLDGSVMREKKKERYIEVPNYADTQRKMVAANMRVADFPVPPPQMTSIGIVLFYSLLGITDYEISGITGLHEDQIGRIRMSDSYSDIQKTFLDKIVESDIEDVRSMFVEGSRVAAGTMIGLMKDSESEGIKLAAAKDILDRAGQRPADVVEHRHRMENTLTIHVVKKDSLEDLPVIEGELVE